MQDFMFTAYRCFSILLYLFLSAVLVYHRLFRRWIKFSLGFFVVYALGSYIFFERIELAFPDSQTVRPVSAFLFFFGTIACLGYCLVRQLTFWQSIGVLSCYLFLLAVFVFVSDFAAGSFPLPGTGAIQSFVVSLPYVLFYVGTPIVFGYCLYRGFGLKESIGIYMVFCFSLLLMVVATANYVDVPFGFVYELSAHSRAWIEIATVLFIGLGLPMLVGCCLANSWTLRETIGGVVVFLALAGAVFIVVGLTNGYDFMVELLGE